MSLATLVNGADCGPANPLQSLTKNLESDRGFQQVHAARMCIHTFLYIDKALNRITLNLTGLVLREAYACTFIPSCRG
jgi:hypothetical protein